MRRRHKGNWGSYIEKWEAYQIRLTETFDRGRAVIVKSRDLRIEGAALERYIEQVATRIEVTKCLAAVNMTTAAGVPSNKSTLDRSANSPAKGFGKGRAFGTAAGAKTVAGLTTRPNDKIFRVSSAGLNLEIASRCDAGTAIFEIFNRGEKWPRLASVSVLRVKPNKLLSKRSLRLTKSQLMSFKVEDGARLGEVGIRIEPSWTKRSVAYDARINCAAGASR